MDPSRFLIILALGLFLIGYGDASGFPFHHYAQRFNLEFFDLQHMTELFHRHNDAKAEETAASQSAVVQSNRSYLSGSYEYITYWDKRYCSLAGESVKQDATDGGTEANRRPSLRVKCIPTNGNGTLRMLSSLKEVVSVLAPHGNSTKRNQTGTCVVLLFYSKTCIHSAMAAPHFNALARHFLNLTVAAIDANEFHVLNAEFGIVGLPTIMFFHQGRTLVKYNGTEISITSLANFVTRHSGMEPLLVNQTKPASGGHYPLHYISDDFKGPLSNKVEYRTDYWLYVAWAFIILCACHYFSKSSLYAQIIEMIKRNWRESAAHHG
ncbi:thioredoxin domain-containing protein 15 [Anopheles aquasalis]|uniref:thioredoxin domain-containing protein 15 n=1 Tax=Anopheles aquasalis TaxID=42839 RepID=UPI00215A7132|nr:thioredoxin domain-containing protein 15 [Anopheles aquasalis]